MEATEDHALNLIFSSSPPTDVLGVIDAKGVKVEVKAPSLPPPTPAQIVRHTAIPDDALRGQMEPSITDPPKITSTHQHNTRSQPRPHPTLSTLHSPSGPTQLGIPDDNLPQPDPLYIPTDRPEVKLSDREIETEIGPHRETLPRSLRESKSSTPGSRMRIVRPDPDTLVVPDPHTYEIWYRNTTGRWEIRFIVKPSRIMITKDGKPTPVGLGLFTARSYSKGEMITYYDGQLISHKEASKRAKTPSGKSLIYVNKDQVVDGSCCSTGAQFANHTCRSKATAEALGSSRWDDLRGTHTLKATHRLDPDTEITWDYRSDYWKVTFDIETQSVPPHIIHPHPLIHPFNFTPHTTQNTLDGVIAYSTHQTDHGMIAYVEELHVSKHKRGSHLSVHLLCHILKLHPYITHLHFVTRHSAPQQAPARHIFFTLLDCEKGVPREQHVFDHELDEETYTYCRINRSQLLSHVRHPIDTHHLRVISAQPNRSSPREMTDIVTEMRISHLSPDGDNQDVDEILDAAEYFIVATSIPNLHTPATTTTIPAHPSNPTQPTDPEHECAPSPTSKRKQEALPPTRARTHDTPTSKRKAHANVQPPTHLHTNDTSTPTQPPPQIQRHQPTPPPEIRKRRAPFTHPSMRPTARPRSSTCNTPTPDTLQPIQHQPHHNDAPIVAPAVHLHPHIQPPTSPQANASSSHSHHTPSHPTPLHTSSYIPPHHICYTPFADAVPTLSTVPTLTASIVPNITSTLLDAYHAGENILPPGDTTLEIANLLEQATDAEIRSARTRVPRRRGTTILRATTPTTDKISKPSRRRNSQNPRQTRRCVDSFIRRNRRFDMDIT